jgi:NADH pyrophosphatase NudC (nudix superfamily)
MKNEALRMALEALDSKYILGCGEWRGQQLKAVTAIKEALAQPAPMQEPDCKDTGVCVQTGLACFGQAAQPAQEPNNFCPRCGKRLEGVLGRPQMHTCTPPLWGHV